MAQHDMAAPAGIEQPTLEPWLAEHCEAVRPPFSYRLISGGRSNLTYELRDAAGRRMVLRRPPLGNILQSAHDVAREHRIISALDCTPVPVAAPLALCLDPAVNGAPFYVMELVEGPVVRHVEDAERWLDLAGRATAGRSLISTMVALHAVDPDAVGLGELGRKEHYAERQLNRWYQQFRAAADREVPVIDEVHRRLSEAVPEQRRVGIVHGDFRIDNCVLGGTGSVKAVLDWELCTLGDPLADLGLLMVYWAEPGDPPDSMLTGSATSAPGFPSRAEVVDLYAELSRADVSDLNFFIALGYWKTACIFEGIRARYGAGVMGDEWISAPDLARHVERLGDSALDFAKLLD
jgi:aminoglycoside phosphotransferase (APT) family kinase protein